MGKKATHPRTSIIDVPDNHFVDQKILTDEKTFSFDDNNIEAPKYIRAFPAGAIFRPFDAKIQPDFVSSSWVCFPEYHLYLGLSYPFPGIVSKFFEITKILYIQAMLAV